MNGEIKILGLPDFDDANQRNSFLLMSRSAFSNYSFYSDIEHTKKEFPDKNVIDFVLKNKGLSLEEFTQGIQDIID